MCTQHSASSNHHALLAFGLIRLGHISHHHVHPAFNLVQLGFISRHRAHLEKDPARSRANWPKDANSPMSHVKAPGTLIGHEPTRYNYLTQGTNELAMRMRGNCWYNKFTIDLLKHIDYMENNFKLDSQPQGKCQGTISRCLPLKGHPPPNVKESWHHL
ncbi:hypothetical protein SLA2020_266250 [Shorea laevis]